MSVTEKTLEPSWGHSRILVGMSVPALTTLALLISSPAEVTAAFLRFDSLLIEGLRTDNDASNPIGPWWLRLALEDITALGGRTLITLVTLVAAGYLIAVKRAAIAALLVATIAGGAIANMLLKAMFSRARPDVVTHLVEAHSSSFPSAHTMNSAVAYLTLGFMLAHGESRRPLRTYFLSVGITLTALVGFSRVYLGVHWPTDVLAGWCIGASWVALCLLIARAIQQRRHTNLA